MKNQPMPSSVKKKMSKIKENREEPGSSELESAQKLKEAERDFLQQ